LLDGYSWNVCLEFLIIKPAVGIKTAVIKKEGGRKWRIHVGITDFKKIAPLVVRRTRLGTSTPLADVVAHTMAIRADSIRSGTTGRAIMARVCATRVCLSILRKITSERSRPKWNKKRQGDASAGKRA
jgi:hypothetical protein